MTQIHYKSCEVIDSHMIAAVTHIDWPLQSIIFKYKKINK